MAFKGKITCDVCGVEKGKTNHWFTAEPTLWGGIRFDRWNYEREQHSMSANFHLCGEACAVKKLSEFLRTAQ